MCVWCCWVVFGCVGVRGGWGLEGDARLSVSVSQPPLLRLIPAAVLEATGRTLLAGILLSIKNRVGQQLLADFEAWCLETPA